MAKRKAKRKSKKVKKAKKAKKKKKTAKRAKKSVRGKKAKGRGSGSGGQGLNERVLGIVDHFFGKISVVAFKAKSPLKVGDMIHIKGHTTDFTQRIDSMQMEHQNIQAAKKGDEIGIRVKGKCRTGDTVFLAAKEQGIATQSALPITLPRPVPPAARPKPKSSGSYEGKKFIQF